MPFLVAAVVLFGAVALINLALTLGMARRLRQYAERLNARPSVQDDNSVIGRPTGSAVGPFHAVATDGTPVDETWFTAPTLVAFFSPGCGPCDKLLPDFVAAAAHQQALAIIDGDRPDDEYLSALAGVATVLVGDQAQPAVDGFGVQGFPAVCTVDGHGAISAKGTHLVESGLLVAR